LVAAVLSRRRKVEERGIIGRIIAAPSAEGRRIDMTWLQYLFGTPRRFRNTTLTVLGVAGINWIFPRLIPTLVNGIVGEIFKALNPFIGLAILISILYMGYRIILSPFLPGKRRK
jgi:hypothetical protein